MPACLVTGGAGFIGSHIATTLAQEGWKVRVLDNLATGKRANLEAVADRVEFIEGSILDPTALKDAMRGVDFVFHKAAMVSVPQSVAEPVRCHEICATGTLNVLLAARDAKVRRVVYAASSSCYGDATPCPIRESSPLQALSPYAAGKLAGEHYCSAIAACSDLETVRLRYFNVFGPKQDPNSPYSGVISIFCLKMLSGQAPSIFGDGLQTRDFVFVDDVVRANRLAATSAGVSGNVFNIGRGGRITLLDLVTTLNRLLKTDLQPKFAAPRTGDVRESQADISAAKDSLGFDPQVDFADGLARCLDYYRSLLPK